LGVCSLTTHTETVAFIGFCAPDEFILCLAQSQSLPLRMRLNLGCGPGPILAKNYIHIDASRKLLLAKTPILGNLAERIFHSQSSWDRNVEFKNIVKMKLKSNSVQAVYSSHLLEHLYYNQCENLLRMLHDSLTDEGTIRLALPDYDAFIFKFVESFKQNALFAMQEFEASLLSYPTKKPHFRAQLWSQITGNLHTHRWHPNFAVVEQMLLEVGYTDIKRCKFRESSLEEIHQLENREYMTFYIEAKK
jgi:predicted SAM-dependent methyltransferase